jgi:DHA2 family multidrug resistance protein
MAFATIAPQHRTDGASLLNLLRSLGASIGISVVTTLLGTNTQTSHADLAQHITNSSVSLIDASTADRFGIAGDTVMAIVNAEITRQAMMVAYIDDFWLMMWITLAAAPLTLLMRKNRAPAGPVALSE